MSIKVNVRINNRMVVLLRPYPYESLIDYWSHSVENYQYIIRSRPWYRKCKICKQKKHKDTDHVYVPIWDGKINFLKRDMLPAGLFYATYKDIQKKEHIKFKIIKSVRVPSLRKQKYW